MERDSRDWYVKGADGSVYGPARTDRLVEWAREGRVEPGGFISRDRVTWVRPQTVGILGMKWLVESEPGRIYGPFHRDHLIRLSREGGLPETAKFYRLHELPVDRDPEPRVVEKRVEVPVEKVVERVVEKRVEVPVEKLVERVVEKRVEVPVEKIVERIVRVEVPAPAPAAVVEPEVLEPEVVDAPVVAPEPQPRRTKPESRAQGGLFGADRARLAALESAARRELAQAGRRGIGGLFGGGK